MLVATGGLEPTPYNQPTGRILRLSQGISVSWRLPTSQPAGQPQQLIYNQSHGWLWRLNNQAGVHGDQVSFVWVEVNVCVTWMFWCWRVNHDHGDHYIASDTIFLSTCNRHTCPKFAYISIAGLHIERSVVGIRGLFYNAIREVSDICNLILSLRYWLWSCCVAQGVAGDSPPTQTGLFTPTY